MSAHHTLSTRAYSQAKQKATLPTKRQTASHTTIPTSPPSCDTQDQDHSTYNKNKSTTFAL
ncbi:hypothetical protein HMPREF3185_00410 [Porphyromonas somerae]|uniref:Uncharacterized protein n=1 Tax=Porphyromonas somerae TaxID=322095 RepID=A0A134BCH5_9PORP|nr:hypothetical protein HMPREF3184_00410 [Porphyromonadaceae bacterium KA00676]KXB77653.1 hypothetical protein HMPREF3185_00410 [Porphyromonas somerae]